MFFTKYVFFKLLLLLYNINTINIQSLSLSFKETIKTRVCSFHTFFLQVPLVPRKNNFCPFLSSKSGTRSILRLPCFQRKAKVVLVVLAGYSFLSFRKLQPKLSCYKYHLFSIPFDKNAALIGFFKVILHNYTLIMQTISKCCVAIITM